MSRVEEILRRARFVLADVQEQRWSTDRLLTLIDEAQKDIARHTRLLNGTVQIPLYKYVSEYKLPGDLYLIQRASIDGCPLPFVSYDKMDEYVRKQAINSYSYYRYYPYQATCSNFGDYKYCWEAMYGKEIEAVLYDKRNQQEIRVFPIPAEHGTDDLVPFDQLEGVLTTLTNAEMDSPFGIATDVTGDVDPVEESDVGEVTGLTQLNQVMKLWYIRDPADVVDTDSELEIPTMYDTAIRYFVIAQAFYDDNDAGFQAKGNNFISLYERELGLAKDFTVSDGITNPSVHTTTYRGPFQ